MIDILNIKDAIKQRNSLDGEWLGTVVNNNDPLGRSRVQVKLDDLTKDIPNSDLPWYLVVNHPNTSSNSHVSIPRISSRVLVEFPNNNIYDGIVTKTIVIKPADKNS